MTESRSSPGDHEFRTFMAAHDFSPHSSAAIDVAADLARRLGAKLHVVHVIHSPTYAYGFGAFAGPPVTAPIDVAGLRAGAMESLRERIADVKAPGGVEPHVVDGPNIAAALHEAAERLGADLIVMGTHGRTGLAHAFLGSVTERTLRNAPCPVLTVRHDEDA